MTEFVVFSDIHIHNFTYGAERVEVPGFSGLYNSRLRDSILVLDEIIEYVYTHNIKHVLFGGDLFHKRKLVGTDVRTLAMDRLVKLSELAEVHMLVGNHDMGDRGGSVHHLYGLDSMKNMYVHDNYDHSYIGTDFQLLCVPYKADLKDTIDLINHHKDKKKPGMPSILLAHAGMQGARVGSDYVLISDSDIKVSDIPHDEFTLCLFGHFHEHQQLFRNGWFIGATHQHNWSDSGGKRGFLHVKLDNDKFELKHIETKSPKFILLNEGDSVDHIKPGDFVNYISTSKKTKKEIEEELGITVQNVIVETEEQRTLELDVSKLDSKSMLEAWVDLKAGSLDKKLLLEEGLRFIGDVT